MAGNSLIVGRIRQQVTLVTRQPPVSGAVVVMLPSPGYPRITDISSHSGRIMPGHKISTFVGSQGSKLVGFHVTRANKGREQWDMKLLNLDACEHQVWEPPRSAEVQSSEQGAPPGRDSGNLELETARFLLPPRSPDKFPLSTIKPRGRGGQKCSHFTR